MSIASLLASRPTFFQRYISHIQRVHEEGVQTDLRSAPSKGFRTIAILDVLEFIVPVATPIQVCIHAAR
jgi:hypothetical protein